MDLIIIAIISNPVNSTVPIAAEVLKKAGTYNPKKLFGVTTLDVCRANTFAAEHMGINPKDVDVTVIGGHAGITILPLYSAVPGLKLSETQMSAITVRTREFNTEILQFLSFPLFVMSSFF
jgi:malate dehydrogenase